MLKELVFQSMQEELTEEFIEENKKQVDWDLISKYQDLSYRFIIKHLDLINLKKLSENKKINMSKDKLETLKMAKIMVFE
jgi:hypothetical protein